MNRNRSCTKKWVSPMPYESLLTVCLSVCLSVCSLFLYDCTDELRLQLERDHECALEELAIGHKAELERIETVNKKAVSDVQQQVMEHQSALEQLTKHHRQEIERIESRNRECVSAIQHQVR